jgi:mannose-6-phosphate isomerase-like protein (cupin superfamily)
MDENLVEIRNYTGDGYKPLVFFGDWRVAVLNYADGMHPDNNKTMERHTETDEVFVLTRGQGILLIGGNDRQVEIVSPLEMEIGTIYNIRRNTWHTILLSRDASVLIVEQDDTGEHNSEIASLSAEFHSQIVEIANRELKFV